MNNFSSENGGVIYINDSVNTTITDCKAYNSTAIGKVIIYYFYFFFNNIKKKKNKINFL